MKPYEDIEKSKFDVNLRIKLSYNVEHVAFTHTVPSIPAAPFLGS